MQFQFCSDLHLEFPENADYLRENPVEAEADILVIAGDLVPFTQLNNHLPIIKRICEPFKQVYWLPGNHEYYYADLNFRTGSFIEKILPNLTLLNNQSISIGQTELIFSTLWTRINDIKAVNIQSRLSDFYLIKKDQQPLSISNYNELHESSVKYIRDALENSQDKQQIVISHHCPTFLHYPEQYKNSPINEAFAVELNHVIEQLQPSVWIYGHTHINTPGFQIGSTTLKCNQLGYVRHNQHHSFKANSIIDLKPV